MLKTNRGKRGLFRMIFSRTGLFVLLLLLQIGALVFSFSLVKQYQTLLYGALTIFSAVLVVFIINKPGNPAMKISWILPIMVFPVFGALLYLFVKLQIGTRLQGAKLRAIMSKTSPYLQQNAPVLDKLEQCDPAIASLARYVGQCGGYPIYQNTSAQYLPTGEIKYDELKKQLEQAERFIFLEYFIIAEGRMWDGVLEILQRKAAQGVEVRVMYDGMCSLGNLPYHYVKQLRAMGIQCQVFSPMRPALSTYQNNRDHRKIVVIDGNIAFTGGINLADEYINVKKRFGHWKDTAIMIRGEAVRSFTLMFLQLWDLCSSSKEDYEKYLDSSPTQGIDEGYVMPYADSPLDSEQVSEMVYMDLINTAQRYVHIMTPYLILDHEMEQALTYAAKRGVDVQIIMPGVPDKWYALAVGKTYYASLIEAGVKIYEYTPGFSHAKVFITDDREAVVGTINLDFRSLYLHFECAAYLYDSSEIPWIEADFCDTRSQCRLLTLEDCQRIPLFTRIAGKLLRLFAPLM